MFGSRSEVSRETMISMTMTPSTKRPKKSRFCRLNSDRIVFQSWQGQKGSQDMIAESGEAACRPLVSRCFVVICLIAECYDTYSTVLHRPCRRLRSKLSTCNDDDDSIKWCPGEGEGCYTTWIGGTLDTGIPLGIHRSTRVLKCLRVCEWEKENHCGKNKLYEWFHWVFTIQRLWRALKLLIKLFTCLILIAFFYFYFWLSPP